MRRRQGCLHSSSLQDKTASVRWSQDSVDSASVRTFDFRRCVDTYLHISLLLSLSLLETSKVPFCVDLCLSRPGLYLVSASVVVICFCIRVHTCVSACAFFYSRRCGCWRSAKIGLVESPACMQSDGALFLVLSVCISLSLYPPVYCGRKVSGDDCFVFLSSGDLRS